MSSAPKRSIPVKTDAEWARETDRRVAGMETPEAQRVGPWVLSAQQGTGKLIASHVDGGSVLLASPPPAGEGADPDALVEPPEPEAPPGPDDWALSTCGVRRGSFQTFANATWAAIVFDVVDWDHRRKESAAQADGTGIVIRETGIYTVDAAARWQSNISASSAGHRLMAMTVNGTNVAVDQRVPAGAESGLRIVRTLYLAAGDVIRVNAWQNSGGNLSLDTTGFGGNTWPSLCANMVRRL